MTESEIQDGAIHLMQVIPGLGDHYMESVVNMAIENVLEHAEERVLAEVREKLDRLWASTPESWSVTSQEGYMLGYKQAIRDAIMLLDK